VSRQPPGRESERFFNRSSGLAEVVIPPRSASSDRTFSQHGNRERRPDRPCSTACRHAARHLRHSAGAVVLSGIVEQSYRAIDWTTVVLVGAMMPLSMAMVETGAAKLKAEYLLSLVGDAGPIALLAGLFC
jgi:hypothetical protein